MSTALTVPFHGASRQKLDDRGRCHLPVKWVDQVRERGDMVLTAGPKGSLLLLEREAWEEAAARIGQDPLVSDVHRRLRSLFIGLAEAVTPDKTNRIVIGEALRQYAGLDEMNAAFLAGLGHSIEIWAQPRWQAETAAAVDEQQLFAMQDTPGNPARGSDGGVDDS